MKKENTMTEIELIEDLGNEIERSSENRDLELQNQYLIGKNEVYEEIFEFVKALLKEGDE